MRTLDEAIFKWTTYEKIWRRTTGYWRAGAPLYYAPNATYSEPDEVPPPAANRITVADVALAITECNVEEAGVRGMRWQSTFRVLNGFGSDICAKLMLFHRNGAGLKARENSGFADYEGNVAVFARLEQPRYQDVFYTVNFFLPDHAFVPHPGQTHAYFGKAIIMQGQSSQALLTIFGESGFVEFSKTDS